MLGLRNSFHLFLQASPLPVRRWISSYTTMDDLELRPLQPYSRLLMMIELTSSRKCGKVVCDNCSPHRITLPCQYIVRNPADEELPSASTTWGGERVRVCNPCVPDPNFAPPLPLSSDRQQQSPRTTLPNIAPHPGMPFGGSMNDQFGSFGQGPRLHTNAPPPPPPGLHARHHRNAASLGQPLPTSLPAEIEAALDPYRPYLHAAHRPRRPTIPPPSAGPSSAHHASIFSMQPRALAPGPAPGPLAYPPPPPPNATPLEPCLRCGAALPPRGPDPRAAALRAAHFEGRCAAPRTRAPPPPPPFPRYVYGRPPPPAPLPLQHAAPPMPMPMAGGAAGSLPAYGPVAVGPPAPAMAVYAATEKDCVDADGDQNECVICLEEFAVGDELGLLECFCKFHRRCIVEWYEKGSGVCPTHKVIGGGGLD